MRKLLFSGVLLALMALPVHAYGGRDGHAGPHGSKGHHGFRGGHRFPRQPFFAWGAFGAWRAFDWLDPVTVVVTPQLPATLTIPAAPADPKFVSPPAPSSPSPDGLHAVIVQRG